MHSETTNPLAPTKVGILPSGFRSRYSSLASSAETMVLVAKSKPYDFATAKIAGVRGLNCVSDISIANVCRQLLFCCAYWTCVKSSERHFEFGIRLS